MIWASGWARRREPASATLFAWYSALISYMALPSFHSPINPASRKARYSTWGVMGQQSTATPVVVRTAFRMAGAPEQAGAPSAGKFDTVAVVSQYPEVLALAKGLRFTPVRNGHPDWGISHTISLGLDALGDDRAGACFLVSDQPLLRRERVEALVELWRGHPEKIAALDLALHREGVHRPVHVMGGHDPLQLPVIAQDAHLGGVAVGDVADRVGHVRPQRIRPAQI